MALDTIGREFGEQGRVPDRVKRTWYVQAEQIVADLRRLAEHCEFGATFDEMLRDVFVLGINKETSSGNCWFFPISI